MPNLNHIGARVAAITGKTNAEGRRVNRILQDARLPRENQGELAAFLAEKNQPYILSLA